MKVGHLNALASLGVVIHNFSIMIYDNDLSVFGLCRNVLPFLISGALFFLVRHNDKLNSYILLAIGLISSATGDYLNTVGVTLFCFSTFLNKDDSFIKLGVILVVFSLIIKIFVVGMQLTNLTSTILLYCFILSVFFFIIFQPKDKPSEYSLLTQEQYEVLYYLAHGYTHKEIVDKLSDLVSVHTVRKRIERARIKYDCKTSHELIFRLSQTGHFDKKSDKVYKI